MKFILLKSTLFLTLLFNVNMVNAGGLGCRDFYSDKTKVIADSKVNIDFVIKRKLTGSNRPSIWSYNFRLVSLLSKSSFVSDITTMSDKGSFVRFSYKTKDLQGDGVSKILITSLNTDDLLTSVESAAINIRLNGGQLVAILLPQPKWSPDHSVKTIAEVYYIPGEVSPIATF